MKIYTTKMTFGLNSLYVIYETFIWNIWNNFNILFLCSGKIYVENERARLTHKLAMIKEKDGENKEAATIMQVWYKWLFLTVLI